MTEDKLQAFFKRFGEAARSPGRVYVVGGASSVLLAIRPMTLDIDLKLCPEPAGGFEAIAELKEILAINVELASPDDFIPSLPGWESRSEFIGKFGKVEFFHMDFYSQALAKIQRGHETDLADVHSLIALGKVEPQKLASLYGQIRSNLIRFPAIDANEFDSQVAEFLASLEADGG